MTELLTPFFVNGWDWLEGECQWNWTEEPLVYIDPIFFMTPSEVSAELERRQHAYVSMLESGSFTMIPDSYIGDTISG